MKPEDPRAGAVLERAAGLHPEDAGVLRLLGARLERLGEREKALMVYRRLDRVVPGDLEARAGVERMMRPGEGGK